MSIYAHEDLSQLDLSFQLCDVRLNYIAVGIAGLVKFHGEEWVVDVLAKAGVDTSELTFESLGRIESLCNAVLPR